MAAATSDREFIRRDGLRTEYGIAAATQLYNGIMVANVGGYAVAATDAVGRPVLGLVDDGGDLDNSAGLAGALNVSVVTLGAAWMVNDTVNPVAAGDVGKSCYVEDNQTVRTFVTGGANSRAGRVLGLSATDGVLVMFDGGNPESAEDFEIADDLVVGDDAEIGGDLAVLGGLTVTDLSDCTAAGVNSLYASADGGAGAVPTAASLAAAFGAAGAANDGALRVFHNTNGAGSDFIVVGSNSLWFAAACTVV